MMEKPCRAALEERFFLIPRLGPIRWTVGGRDRLEGRVRADTLFDPLRIIGVIRRDPELAAIAHCRSKIVEGLGRYDAALLVALFRPGIGKENESAGDALRRQRGNQHPCIIDKQPDIGERAATDIAQQFGDAGLEDLAANKAALRPALGLKCQMLAAASGR